MRKDVTEDPKAVADVLSRCEYISLALVDEEGAYSVPVSCGFEAGVLYFHSSKKGRKMDALRRHMALGARVAFSAAVDLEMKTGQMACDYGYKFRGVLGSGLARIVEGAEEKKAALNTLMRKYGGRDTFPYDDKILGVTEVVAIDVDRATARLKLS
jgi:nitroimidazol reductase NimA-like FMN-containing flavoprotein (pyridoxamine 5'-phosphate oxidase superfamily)